MTSLITQLRGMGYRVEVWSQLDMVNVAEITDLATAATVYVPESSTLDEALTAINKKNEQFRNAENQTK